MTEKIQDTIKPVKMVDTETPQQKQAAAKLALRKQLEKTLLQVKTDNSIWFLIAISVWPFLCITSSL